MLDVDGVRLVLVTGPQRSGTTFASQAIASDLGWQFRDEMAFNIHCRDSWEALIATNDHSVIQCPSMMRYVHNLDDDVLVVVMRRRVADILASQHRINWDGNSRELVRYGLLDGESCRIKYQHWDRHKHEGPARWVELDYEAMSGHPLWVEAEHRRNFTPKQTTREVA